VLHDDPSEARILFYHEEHEAHEGQTTEDGRKEAQEAQKKTLMNPCL
jgi:hypothetical protein